MSQPPMVRSLHQWQATGQNQTQLITRNHHIPAGELTLTTQSLTGASHTRISTAESRSQLIRSRTIALPVCSTSHSELPRMRCQPNGSLSSILSRMGPHTKSLPAYSFASTTLNPTAPRQPARPTNQTLSRFSASSIPNSFHSFNPIQSLSTTTFRPLYGQIRLPAKCATSGSQVPSKCAKVR